MTDPEILKANGYICIQLGPHLWSVRGEYGRMELFPGQKLIVRYKHPEPYDDVLRAVKAVLPAFPVDSAEQQEAHYWWKLGLEELTARINARVPTLSPAK